MGFFKKLTNSTSNFFKKAGGQADNFFKKSGDAVAKAANQTGGALKQAGNQVGGVAKQVGNTLEKAAPIAADVGAGLAVLSGNPELAPVLIGAGQAAQRAGQMTKRAGVQTQQAGRMANNMLQQQSTAFQATIGQARDQVATTNAQIQQRLNDAGNLQPSNALAQIHSDLAQ
jgi:hypothetical protein